MADAIAIFITWYKLGTRKTSMAPRLSFSRILLRDGGASCIGHYLRTDFISIGLIYFWYVNFINFLLKVSDALRKHPLHFELFASHFNDAFGK